ncbi:uncharacterized protein LDX57_000917 [Aspergillus melleus]|uniref:uncharacterized protein n=1 Tax=Aspergillus melleus TaxID=138277 RepID=UPI001E8E42E0|nr:uncharacterized protein LDX57_000917 [Aspergillus melleus]KAH8423162.1 hypothetical protein LDX57_000917 [Aspergillus melleus]
MKPIWRGKTPDRARRSTDYPRDKRRGPQERMGEEWELRGGKRGRRGDMVTEMSPTLVWVAAAEDLGGKRVPSSTSKKTFRRVFEDLGGASLGLTLFWETLHWPPSLVTEGPVTWTFRPISTHLRE